MSIKRYGIYLAYAPTVDLRNQGLGRYLASFVRGVTESVDIELIIACPSWSKESLDDLFKSEGLSAEIAVISPRGKPYLLRAYELFLRWTSKGPIKTGQQGKLRRLVRRYQHEAERRLSQAHSPKSLFFLIMSTLRLGLLITCCAPLLWVNSGVTMGGRLVKSIFRPLFKKLGAYVAHLTSTPKDNNWVRRQFKAMNDVESIRMKRMIEARDDVIAWYSPTAFWPAFNELNVPTLMCVPDVVLTDFSIGFSGVGGDRFLETFETIRQAIQGAKQIVTYSDQTKWHTLVDQFSVQAPSINVVRHAPNTLNHLIDIEGFPDPVTTSRNHCKKLFLWALQRVNTSYTAHFSNKDVKFLFYPSQIRPNKNIMTLLRAFEYLVHDRKIGLKLILTGDINNTLELNDFIQSHRLQADVISLRNLSLTELAACYRLAELAVNPSLSEGGCPFTFTEALSVGTPAVMSRIPVTLEVLTDPQLQTVSLFDPYSWRDMADRIETAINTRPQLLSLQRKAYEQLSLRTWTDVASEHIALLDHIAADNSANSSSEGKTHER